MEETFHMECVILKEPSCHMECHMSHGRLGYYIVWKSQILYGMSCNTWKTVLPHGTLCDA